MNLTENKPDLADTMEIEAICEKDREWYKSQRAALKDYKINRLKSEHAYDVLLRFAHSPSFIKRFGLIPDEQIMDNHNIAGAFVSLFFLFVFNICVNISLIYFALLINS